VSEDGILAAFERRLRGGRLQLTRYEAFACPVARLLLGGASREVLHASSCTPPEPSDQWLSYFAARYTLPPQLWARVLQWRARARADPELCGVVLLSLHLPTAAFLEADGQFIAIRSIVEWDQEGLSEREATSP